MRLRTWLHDGGGYQQPIKESGIGSPWLAQGGGVIVFHQYDVIEGFCPYRQQV